MKKLYLALAMAGLLSLSPVARAQDAATPASDQTQTQPQPHGNISPEERAARKAALQQKLKNMTPEERQQFFIERKSELQKRYNAATPEQQAKMKPRMDKLDERIKNPNASDDLGGK
jgi:Spy/CpxP family protein refolding chaperone